jgi:hypothetical protein
MAIFLKIFKKKILCRDRTGLFILVSQLAKFRPKKTLVRTLLLYRLLYQLFALCNFFSLHYLLENIVHNFIFHKVMAHAPCWWQAPNLSKVYDLKIFLLELNFSAFTE